MASVSKQTARRIKQSREVQSSAQTHGKEVAQAVADILFPQDEVGRPTIENLMDAMSGALDRTSTEIAQADEALVAERTDDGEPRDRRDQARTNLREELIEDGATMEGGYGPAILGVYNLGGSTPMDYDLLLHKGTTTEKLLRERPLTEPPKRKGVTVDTVALAEEIRVKCDSLRVALEDVKREGRELQIALESRDRAVERWYNTYLGVSWILMGLYRLTGRQDLEDRVRPAERSKPVKGEVVLDEEAADVPEPLKEEP